MIMLKKLQLQVNRLTSTIPTELGLLSSSLHTLDLQGNQLEGTIPNELGQLVNLRFLHLQNNQLTGVVPSPVYDVQYYSYNICGNNLSVDRCHNLN